MATGDPLYEDVTLHITGEGTVGVKPTDISGFRRPIAVTGDWRTSSVGPKFGSGCLAGTSGFMDADGVTFGTSDFTIEFNFLATNFTSTPTLFDMRVVGNIAIGGTIYNDTGTRFTFFAANANRISTANLTAGQWYHMAISRSAGQTRMFLDGVQQGSAYADANNYNTTALRWCANYLGTTLFNGRLDNIRVTVGAARYTANFAPPAAAFLDYAGLLSGTVKSASGVNVARTVRAYREDTGALVDETVSNAASGAFTLKAPTIAPYTVEALPGAGEPLAALIYSGVTPQ